MTLDEARDEIGAAVIYTPTGGRREDGEIVSVGKQFVFVRYLGDRGAKATSPEDLIFLNPERHQS